MSIIAYNEMLIKQTIECRKNIVTSIYVNGQIHHLTQSEITRRSQKMALEILGV